ncbi:hypothetical protein FPZ49_29985 [Paenibacillus cremeus]|uniref:Uncharacterized protein n=1 Tax=Paenibacillus cremeus TaxID=2163881 RepID=A0A559K056_9BACL|nr:hypothetical protein FPZ49_29985 [Paenibacillus cremeus]
MFSTIVECSEVLAVKADEMESVSTHLRDSSVHIVRRDFCLHHYTRSCGVGEQVLASVEEQHKMIDNIVVSIQTLNQLITELEDVLGK